ncbi:lachesin-like [Hyposmocoma kahamanoa]|uniref:lachesin-like n=1 Tax=Hyposmocoma kahamanoa TaxID=1477025 RepID=UPI000E6D8D37|nr:lachesin-like [Hyposmocoma kahamanoa]
MAFSYDFLTILTCLAIIAQAQQTPTISYITQEQTRDIGGHVDLVCAVHDAQDYPVLWVKYNRLNETEPLPLSTSSSLITKDPRFSLQFEAASGTSKLSIKNIQETDAGLYQCRVQMSVNNKVTADVELRVRDSPIFIDNSTRSLDTIAGETHAQQTPTISYINQEQTPVIGGQVDLICAVRDAQDYPVLWVKYDRTNETEPQPLSSSSSLIIKDPRFSLKFDAASGTSELSIKDIQETDAGLYQCRVQMSVSNKVTADVELRVRSPPIFIDNSTRSLVTIAGESVQMECYAGGFPPPEISWRRENNVILPTGGLIYR